MFIMAYVLVGMLIRASIGQPTATDTIDNIPNIRSQYAADMMSYMNPLVQPCDDFYEYACGNWKNVIEERQSEMHRSYFTDIQFKVNDFIDVILQKADINDLAPEYADEFVLAKKFYKNCLSAELYYMHRSPEYLDVIQSIGGFPAANPLWQATEFNWINMSAHLSNYGVKSLISEKRLNDHPFSPYFPLPEFGFDIALHYDTISNTSSIEYYTNQKRMYDILSLYVVAENRIDLAIKGIFEFLKEALFIMEQFEENQDKCEALTNETDYKALQEQWMPYFDIAWMGKTVELGFEFGPCGYFYREFNKVVEKHKESAANYLSLKFLYHMNANLQAAKFQKDYCTSTLRNTMAFFFDHLYMKTNFNDEKSNNVKEMYNEIQERFRVILQEIDWLDEPTREAALRKLSLTGLYVGRFEDTAIIKRCLVELKKLRFVEGSYEANNLNLAKYTTYMDRYQGLHANEISNTTKPLAVMLGILVNGFYYRSDNNVYISASALQPPVFLQNWPDAVKYGTIGFILGHEISHGFDTKGSAYDHAGVYNNWWSDKSKEKFDERAQCFVDFYSQYNVPEINRNIDGAGTKDENIADVGAIHLALMAYRSHVDKESKKFGSRTAFDKREQMPGLNATPEQLFFLGSAQMWCSSFKVADYWRELKDLHTINKYRVMGMVSNNEDFAKAYNCPVGSKMNPTRNKCKIW